MSTKLITQAMSLQASAIFKHLQKEFGENIDFTDSDSVVTKIAE